MSMDELLATIRAFDGVLELAPTRGSEYPELTWGDHFFYYAPDGVVPPGQPYATVVTKDYPDDTASALNPPGRWRLNIHVGRSRLAELTRRAPSDGAASAGYSATDVVLPHPLYAELGWVAVVNPGAATGHLALELLRDAHDDARGRAARRASTR